MRDGQVISIKTQPAAAPAPAPAATQPAQAAKKEKPSLEDLLKGILK
jgi:ribosomal protein L12E/L44/L45/RPP1/RPP2